MEVNTGRHSTLKLIDTPKEEEKKKSITLKRHVAGKANQDGVSHGYEVFSLWHTEVV